MANGLERAERAPRPSLLNGAFVSELRPLAP
jgi:hypothetical protein